MSLSLRLWTQRFRMQHWYFEIVGISQKEQVFSQTAKIKVPSLPTPRCKAERKEMELPKQVLPSRSVFSGRLIDTPQNNFRVFADGVPVYNQGLYDKFGVITSHQHLSDSVRECLGFQVGTNIEQFAGLIVQVFPSYDVLERIKRLQEISTTNVMLQLCITTLKKRKKML
eukprot:m.102406 g.102406  ORF g.102406 m.102406 type:complete len:170 (-) comp13773_c0_seq1:537-1046(-)